MLQLVDVLQGVMPLPEWFAGFTVGLLVLGLPIVLATAFIQHGGPAQAPPPVSVTTMGELYPLPAERGVPSRLLTWKKAIPGGVGAFVLLIGVGAGWVMFGDGMAGGSGTVEAPS